MSIERVFYCDGPDCQRHVRTMAEFPSCGFIETRQASAGFPDARNHFCSWDCLMKFAAQHPPPEVIEWDDPRLAGEEPADA